MMGPDVVPISKQALGHTSAPGSRRTELKSMSSVPPEPFVDSCARMPTTRLDAVDVLADDKPKTALSNTRTSLFAFAVAATRIPTTRPPVAEEFVRSCTVVPD